MYIKFPSFLFVYFVSGGAEIFSVSMVISTPAQIDTTQGFYRNINGRML